MGKQSTSGESESRPAHTELDQRMRLKMQELIQDGLKEDVTEFLGRARSVRRAAADAETGQPNGCARPMKLATASGTITVRRPRVRDTE